MANCSKLYELLDRKVQSEKSKLEKEGEAAAKSFGRTFQKLGLRTSLKTQYKNVVKVQKELQEAFDKKYVHDVQKKKSVLTENSSLEDLYRFDGDNPFLVEDITDVPKTVQGYAERAKETLSSLVKNYEEKGSTGVVKEGKWKALVEANPALELLFDIGEAVDGNVTPVVNDKMLLPFVIGSFYGLSDNYSDLVSTKDDKKLRDILGIDEMSPVPIYAYANIGKGGLPLDLFSDNLGREIANQAGIKELSSVSRDKYGKLIAGFGVLGSYVLGGNGFNILKPMEGKGVDAINRNREATQEAKIELARQVDPTVLDSALLGNTAEKTEVANGKATDHFVNRYVFIDDQYKSTSALINGINKLVGVLDDFTGGESRKKGPLDEPATATEIRNQQFSEGTAFFKEVLAEQNKVGYEINEGNDLVQEIFGDDTKALAMVMGHSGIFSDNLDDGLGETDIDRYLKADKDLEKPAYTREKAESVMAKDLAILRELEAYQEFAKSRKGNDAPFYFKWFLGGNNRMHIDSNTVNPQNEKELVRWLITAQNNGYEINREDLDAVLSEDWSKLQPEEFAALPDSIKVFIYSLVQGFEGVSINGKEVGDPEKTHFSEVVKSAKLVLEADRDVLIDAIKDPKHGHVGQQAGILASVDKYQAGNESFMSWAMFESDGKTNGLAHKAMQLPLWGQEQDYLAKVAIRGGSYEFKEDEGSFGDVASKGEESDSYQLIASFFHKSLQNSWLYSKKGVNDTNFTGKDVLTSIGLAKFGESGKESSFIIPLDLDNELDPTGVKGELRDFAKAPALEGMYGASLNTLVNNIARGTANNILDFIVEHTGPDGYVQPKGGPTAQELLYLVNTSQQFKIDKELDLDRVMEISSVTRANYTNLVDVMKALQKGNADAVRIQENVISNTKLMVNDATRDAMEQFFGDIDESGERTFNGQIEMQKAILSASSAMFTVFEELFNSRVRELGGDLSREQEIEIAMELLDVMPAVASASSVFDDEQIVFTKTGKTGEKTGNKQVTAEVTLDSAPSDAKKLKYRIANNVVNALRNGFKDPGASMGPIMTHSMDSYNIAAAWLKTVQSGDPSFMMVFDAVVIGGNNLSAIKTMNELIYKQNMSYSYIDEIIESMEKGERLVKELFRDDTDIVYELLNNLTPKDRPKADTYDMALTTLRGIQLQVQESRRNIFSNPQQVGQFVAMPGTVWNANPSTIKANLEADLVSDITALEDYIKDDMSSITEFLEKWYKNTDDSYIASSNKLQEYFNKAKDLDTVAIENLVEYLTLLPEVSLYIDLILGVKDNGTELKKEVYGPLLQRIKSNSKALDMVSSVDVKTYTEEEIEQLRIELTEALNDTPKKIKEELRSTMVKYINDNGENLPKNVRSKRLIDIFLKACAK